MRARSRPRSLFDFGGAAARHYAQGLLMGTADVVPGVSGGTIALIVGIYRQLVDSIGYAASAAFRLVRGDLEGVRYRLSCIAWPLIVPLVAGIATAIVIAARIIPDLVDSYPVETRAFFFGMIAGSIAIPWRRIRFHGVATFAVLAAGALLAFLLTGLPEREASDPGLARVFISAMVAICAMILPGVSGAFLLLVLGVYERSLEAVRDRDFAYIASFLAGAVVGLGLFSTLLKWLLARAHDLTMAALVGLMAGSLRALWPYLDDDRALRGPLEGEPIAAVIALGVAGLAFVGVLAWLGERATQRAGSASEAT
jgi:putative membrane protein